jgi:hypothetical protein
LKTALNHPPKHITDSKSLLRNPFDIALLVNCLFKAMVEMLAIEARDILNLGSDPKPKRYAFDSCPRDLHGHQRQFLFASANTSQWRDAA